ncbi:Gamma-aminobutyric acid receptor subunit beta-3, partial [Armadillidium vulgare]
MIGVKETMTNSIELHLLHQNIEYYGPKTLLEYEVVNSSIYLAKETNIVTITMEYRNLVSYFIASTFAPTFLMVIVGYLTFYFPLNQFNERIMVSLTALLVQSSFFSEVTDSIPKTVYLKKIDIWCIFCILILFFITTALTIINCLL